ncbi:MerR family transcriptional regulator [Mesorhizobium sp. NBSH29]|uniref:helix-turn-helix domain-containing protein n=1 Tax=Mesorhizobium sp. NBSH29 TaxID=2654249 RepID=UPI001896A027|nr:helix-turn-helix domain-containing protein [Mesorhizobium sp. NBSH29]QPC88774.1 MerR family transcriptional regulator [Mesorhizobium sp. NBSH29]
MNLLDIGVLAEKSGVPASTLRYYEEIGLIESLGRHGLRRQFGFEALTQLALISLGKTAGFSLEEIKSAFGKHGAPALPRAALLQRADAIAVQIRQLKTLHDALVHVAECPAPSHMECPKFRRLLSLAPHPRDHQKRRRTPGS